LEETTMRVRHLFALAALSLLLSACGADAITAPEVREVSAQPAYYGGGGWIGGGGRAQEPTQDADSAT
jgi:hypothetical protein